MTHTYTQHTYTRAKTCIRAVRSSCKSSTNSFSFCILLLRSLPKALISFSAFACACTRAYADTYVCMCVCIMHMRADVCACMFCVRLWAIQFVARHYRKNSSSLLICFLLPRFPKVQCLGEFFFPFSVHFFLPIRFQALLSESSVSQSYSDMFLC